MAYVNDASLVMDFSVSKDEYERDNEQACSDSNASDRLVHEKDVIQMFPHAKEIPVAIERSLPKESSSSFPTCTSSAGNIRKQPQMSLQGKETPLVNDRGLPPRIKSLSFQPSSNVCEHKDSVVDKSKLMPDQSLCISSATRELYKSRSDASHQRSPTNPPNFNLRFSKKVSFGSPSATDSALSKEQFQPPLHDHQSPPSKQHSKKISFSQIVQSSSKERSIQDSSMCCQDEHKQENYILFRTRSSNIERQLSCLQSRQQQEQQNKQTGDVHGRKSGSNDGGEVAAGRYFDALEGPELESLKFSEEVLLPLSEPWPFLLRFPIGCFGICLGLASQAILWKVLASSPSMIFLHVHLAVNFALWCLALTGLAVIFTIYTLKCLLYFEAVRREFYHPVRVNFFFAPWIIGMFLAMGIPPSIATSIHPSLWCMFVTPLLMLELKIYGQWLSGGERRLSKVANPSTHLSLVGNFVAALLAAEIRWKEPAIFFFAVGCAHYLVLFVTLYQRLPSAEALPKELHPVFFLFVAAPSTASIAWSSITGDFNSVSKIAYFIALFLYASLAVRVKFFCGFKFSIAWWAYTFPMTASAIAAVQYSIEVRGAFTQVIAVILSAISALMVMMVFISTILHGMWGSLFPNDVAIAITTRRHRKKHKRKSHLPITIAMNKGLRDSKAQIADGFNCLKEKSTNQAALLKDGFKEENLPA